MTAATITIITCICSSILNYFFLSHPVHCHIAGPVRTLYLCFYVYSVVASACICFFSVDLCSCCPLACSLYVCLFGFFRTFQCFLIRCSDCVCLVVHIHWGLSHCFLSFVYLSAPLLLCLLLPFCCWLAAVGIFVYHCGILHGWLEALARFCIGCSQAV